jgi:GT2 family glycosyltransferase
LAFRLAASSPASEAPRRLLARALGPRGRACYGTFVSSATEPRRKRESENPSSQAAACSAGQNASLSERPPYVVAVVLNWNNLPDTLECVDSLQQSDYSNLTIWVVDNHSREDPTAVLHERHPGVRVLRNARNLGYGAGNNSGLKRAMEEGAVYVLLLNNDVVVGADTVRRLVMAAEADARIAMATPRVFYYDRPTEVYWDGGTIDWETGETPHDSLGLPVEEGIKRSQWLDGCSLFVRVAALQDVGFLDERYFLYFEDVDWSVRALRRGWTNAVVLPARAWHKVSRSTGGLASPAVRFYYARNRYLFMSTHRPDRKRFLWNLRYAGRIFREYRLIRHDSDGRAAIVAACVSLVEGRWGPYDPTGCAGLVRLLDTLLLSVARGMSAVKHCLLRIRRVSDRVTGRKQ